MNNRDEHQGAEIVDADDAFKKVSPLRRWTRSQLAEIAGVAKAIPIVTAAALLGQSVAEVRARVDEGGLPGTTQSGILEVMAGPFIKLEAAEGDNPPLMLSRRQLRVRPNCEADQIARLADKNGNLGVEAVGVLTGQTVEEVVADLKAGRLDARRRSRKWVVLGDQLLASYKEHSDVDPTAGSFRRWTRAELAAIVGMPYSIPMETAAAMFGETLKEFKANNKWRKIIRTRLDTPGVSQAVSSQFLKREDYFTINLNPPMMLRDGKLHLRLPHQPDDLTPLTDTNGNIGLDAVRELTGQTMEEVAADILSGRLDEIGAPSGFVPAGQFLPTYRAFRKL